MPTKEQERKALEKIEKILADLGNNPETSYVCRAFQGCVDDARENIENDFANSAKERAEHYEKKYNDAKQEAKEAREALEAMKANAEREAEKRIDKKDLQIMYSALVLQIDAEREAIDKAAAEIVENAEQTGSEEFISAVVAHRKHQNREKALYECSLRAVDKINRM
jgi:F0F1-type ATP synthase membrane subunit b/b'